MTVCPIDYRYGSEQMREIFSEEGRLRRMLLVEAALAESQAQVGMIPSQAASAIYEAATSGRVTTQRVAEIEAEIHHDVMAIVKALAEQSGDAGAFIHLGATSNDIIDTANALQMKEAWPHIVNGCRRLRDELARLARENKATLQVGRTHGQWALPTTFGLKMAVYAVEMDRHLERLDQAAPRVLVGKFMGAVGTGAAMGPKALEVQRLVMDRLDLNTPMVTLQTTQRDRHAELACVLGNIAASLDKFATEVRNLQRSELAEVQEAFDASKQVGSSTMAHKRNPISAENVCGLARVVRGFVTPAFENVPLWHERDLSNSSAERFTISHQMVLTEYLLRRSAKLFSGLVVDGEAMRANLDRACPDIMAEAVMMALAERGMGRQEAHELVRSASMRSRDEGVALVDTLMSSREVSSRMSREEMEAVLRPESYTGQAEELVELALGSLKH